MTRDSAPPTVYVVTHTHWDREWYQPAVRFRQRLVAMIDELLKASPDEPPFLLDGQSIILEDYLHVRPDARDALAHALRMGRIEAGPWYVLADELIPGGESLVRNLLAGRRVLAGLRGAPPPVLYSPDAFGHPASLPLLAREFGFQLAIVWRGYGGPDWPDGDTVRWAAPDDSTVVVHHLPPDGYEFGSSLPYDAEAARERWVGIAATLIARARLSAVLLLNGADHHARQDRLGEAVKALATVAAPAEVRHVGLGKAADDLARLARDSELPKVRGELRRSFGYTWSLQGTFGVRAPLKRQAVRLERELIRDVEPWLALAWRRPGVPSIALEQAAWSTLLACHPHDTLCGCSIDAVAHAMAARLEQGGDEAAGLRLDALHVLVGHDPDETARRRELWNPAVVVRNRAPRPRGGVAEIEILTFERDVPVGPGSAFVEQPSAPDETVSVDAGRVGYQVLSESSGYDRIEPRRGYPDQDLVRVRRAVAWVPAVPAYGISALPLGAGDPGALEGTVRAGGDRETTWMENEHLRVAREAEGAITLTDLLSGRRMATLLSFEDVGDAGDTYTPSLIGERSVVGASRSARLVHAGPLRGEIAAQFHIEVPVESSRAGRSERLTTIPVHAAITLDAGSPFVRVRISGVNTARDHRLRVVFATDVSAGPVWADAAFGPVRRVPVTTTGDTSRELPLPTEPLHRYVTVANESLGATLFADGSTEYEVLADGSIAVTLIRAVGELSRSDLPERPGHAGWPASTPDAQCLGRFEARVAFMLHGPRTDEEIDRIERCADDALFPLVGHTVRALLRVPDPVQGFELQGAGLAFGAAKRSENGEWLVLRCVNLLERAVQGSWLLAEPPVEARLSRLDEAPGEVVPIEGGQIRFTAPPRAAVTLLVR